MNVVHIFEGINPSTRKTAYYVYGLIGVAIGALQVGYSAAELGQPTWLTVALAVFSFIGAAFGITAGQNTPKQLIEIEQDTTDDDRSEEHTSELQSRGHLVCRLLLEKKNS